MTKFDLSFYKDKKVFITGHTGFKGSWMCNVLVKAGAIVTGYSNGTPTEPSLYYLSGVDSQINSVMGDVRDLEKLTGAMKTAEPEIVIHMAAQPIVRESYKNPVYTYETNVMGTVNVLEAVRQCVSVRSVINVTTDKVYLNKETDKGYCEEDELNGYDPYSNSKSCSELVTSSYINAFFGGNSGKTHDGRSIAISTCRAGNVIGGGDFAADRIVPDCIRAVEAGKDIIVRNPFSVRPYQHVLEPIMVYLMIAARQYEDIRVAGSYNVGPDDRDNIKTGDIVTMFCNKWNEDGSKAAWIDRYDGGPHEAGILKLNCNKLKQTFGWQPVWSAEKAIEKIVEFSKVYLSGENVASIVSRQIDEFQAGFLTGVAGENS